MTTSATLARAIVASLPAGDLRSRAQLRLLRLTDKKYELSPFTNGGPYRRLSSPIRGSSIFTTSAPRSPRCIVAKGPETTRHRSRTLMPERASVLDDRIRQILHRGDGDVGLVRRLFKRPIAAIDHRGTHAGRLRPDDVERMV